MVLPVDPITSEGRLQSMKSWPTRARFGLDKKIISIKGGLERI